MPKEFSSENNLDKDDEKSISEVKLYGYFSLLRHHGIGYDSPQVELENLLNFERISLPDMPGSHKHEQCEKKLKSRV